MSDLERRLRRALRDLPDGDPAARERAEARALGALPTGAPRRRPRWLFATAGIAAAVALASVALAATDRLAVRIGKPATGETPLQAAGPPAGRVVLPSGVSGIGLVSGGRLWLGTESGLGVQGLAASSAELSPNALYAAVGIGRSLVAMTPSGLRAWSQPTAGPVVAAAWAPNPIVIAYVARRGDRNELRIIEGDGGGDRLVDPNVAPVRPSWRADTLALAYVTRAGAARIVSYPSLAVARTVSAPGRRIGVVSFGPDGDRLALATAAPMAQVDVVEPGSSAAFSQPSFTAPDRIRAIAWTSPDAVVVAGDERRGEERVGRLWVLPVAERLSAKAAATANGPLVSGLSPLPGGAGLMAAVRVGREAQVWEVAAPRAGADRPLTPRRVLLRVPVGVAGSPTLTTR